MIKITLPYGAEIRQEYDVLDRLISEKQIENYESDIIKSNR